jgi:hypothetical protein
MFATRIPQHEVHKSDPPLSTTDRPDLDKWQFLILKKMKFATLFALTTTSAQAAQLAFPGAEGFGRDAVGGRQGEVYKVTNLK